MLPLPLGYEPIAIKLGVRGEIRTRNNAALDRTRLPVAPPEHWWAVKDSNLGDPKGMPRLQRGAFGQLSQLPERKLSKNWRKAGDSNAYVPKDTGLASQWDTSYPSLPGKKLQEDLKGDYRLDERHHA